MMSRICASSISISRGRFTDISLCLRLTELSSTVILKPSWEQSPLPYPVIDFIRAKYAKNPEELQIDTSGTQEPSPLKALQNRLRFRCRDYSIGYSVFTCAQID